MKLKLPHKTVYNIITVVFLVLVLSSITIITYVANRNSEKLSDVVTDLSHNHFEIDRIDEAIQLLYNAENNSRLYVLNREEDLYVEYMNQLNQVSNLITSIQKNEQGSIEGLLKDKQLKTELYITAKILADSLITDNRIREIMKTPAKSPVVDIEEPARLNVAPIKIVEETIIEQRSKKGLFGRIRDAIVNEPKEKEHRSTTIIQQAEKTKQIVKKPKVNLEASSIQNASGPALSKLTKKEKDLLIANQVLFNELKSLLVDLKNKEVQIKNQRQAKLGDSAASLMIDLKDNNKYILILTLLLTAVILSVLVLLYRNMKALQEEKFKAEEYAKYKSDFVATLSHEIRTPLHSIHAFTDELSKNNTKEGESEVIDAIKLSSNMLISIVNNILDFTKMEKGKFKLNHLPFIPSGIIQEVILGFTIQAKRKGLALSCQLDPSVDMKLYGDAFQLRQLLINIINNSLKYTEKGSILVQANFLANDDFSGKLMLKIEDTGIGIAENQLPTIFDEYNSQKKQSEIEQGSTGLGLSIVKKIVDYQKGNIHVSSQLGGGTIFRVEIPYDIFLENTTNPANPKLNQQARKILIVENDSLNLKIMKLLFVNENCVVSQALNGTEAFEIFMKHDFDIVITDISMPGLNGFQLAQKIRELTELTKASIPIVVLSGYQKPSITERPEISFIDAWLVKPFVPEELLEMVEKLCEKK